MKPPLPMPRSAVRALPLLLLLGLACTPAWRTDKMQTWHPASAERPLVTRLDNGLTVLIEPDHTSPVVALQMWVGVGSADERDGEHGLAHVHEHMLFKGTERRGVGEIASTVEGAGGNINAWTSYDNTVYHIVITSREFGTGLDVLADAVRNSAFDPEELEKEEEVVIEEIRRSDDMPSRTLFKELFKTAYTVHPYRDPVIGTRESVDSFTREGILAFYKRWYVPSNMTLVVVGDVDPTEALAQAEELLGDWEAPVVNRPARPAEPEQTEPRFVKREGEQTKTYLKLAFPLTAANDPDTPAVDALAMLLGQGETSRLFHEVLYKRQLVDGIGTYAYTPRDRGMLLVEAVLDADNLEKALPAIFAEIWRTTAEEADEDELGRIRINMESDIIYDKQSMEGQARKLGFYQTVLGDYSLEDRYLEAIRNLTPEEIRRVAAHYLRPEAMTVALSFPDGAGEGWTKQRVVELARAAREGLTPPATVDHAVTEGEGGVYETTLSNGVRVFMRPRKGTSIISLRAALLGGLHAEDPQTNGINHLLSEMITRGTDSRNAVQIAETVEEIAGSLSGFSGKNSIGLSMEYLARFNARGLDLFTDLLRNPAFSPEELEKARRETLAAIAGQKDSPISIAFKKFYRTLYGDHPLAMDPIGTEETVAAFTPEDLKRMYARVITPENMVLAVAGDFEPEAMAAELEARLGDWTGAKWEGLPRPQPAPIDDLRIGYEQQDKQQSHILLGYLGNTLGEMDDHYALEVMTTILSGQGGRLFTELRDKQSLAYSVTAFNHESFTSGFVAAYIACAPDKIDEARAGILHEFARMRDELVGTEELARARDYLIGSHDINQQELGNQAAGIAFDELYGIGYREEFEYPKRIAKVTAEDVQRVARKYLDPEHYVLTVVGPAPPEGYDAAVDTQ